MNETAPQIPFINTRRFPSDVMMQQIEMYTYTMETLNVDTSTFQPMAVRPKRGIGRESRTTRISAFTGTPALFTLANIAGRSLPSAMVLTTREAARWKPNIEVVRVEPAAITTRTTPHCPSIAWALCNTGSPLYPDRFFRSAIYSAQSAYPAGTAAAAVRFRNI